MLFYLKSHFKQSLCGEEHQYITSPFLFFLKKAGPKKKKITNISYLIINANEIKAINILDFRLTWIHFLIWNNFPNINIELNAELNFLLLKFTF